jgi:hypothetical protein
VGPAPAPTTRAAAPRTLGGVAVISVTNIAGLSGRHLNQFRLVDDKLTEWVQKDLQNRGMAVVPAQTFGQTYTLAFSVDQVDCGKNEQCQMQALIGASYELKRYGSVIRSGKVEERSQFGWEKAVRKISEVIGGDAAAGIVIGPAAAQPSGARPSTARAPEVVAPRDEGRIVVLSETSTAGLTGKRLHWYRTINDALMGGLGKDLQDHGIGVAAGQTASRYTLSVKIEKVDCGPKDQCQAQAAIGASYALKKDGAIIKSGKAEELDKHGWQKPVKKISDRIAADVGGVMGRR